MEDSLTERVIGLAFRVYKELGFGFLESVYGRALSIELRRAGIAHRTQFPIRVYYGGEVVGDFYCDLFVADQLLVELKSVVQLAVVHEVQVVNYLVATRIETGLLLNFGPSGVEMKRKSRVYRPR